MGSVRMTFSLRLVCGLALAVTMPMLAVPPRPALAQAAGTATAQSTRIVGAVTAIDGKSLTIKSDAGATTTVNVSDSARLLRTAPGVKTLAGATPIQFSDLAVGDRVLAVVAPGAVGSTATATTVIAMKQEDIVQKQQAEQADWQKRGVGGLVKAVDASAGTVDVTAAGKTLIIHATPTTIVRRYDPASIKFSDATASSLDQIHPGDQLRARGDRSSDGGDVTADEIVTGTFRNIAGTVISVDASANSVTVTDLATKKPVLIHVTGDSQLHKLPPTMAQGLAARLKGSSGSPSAAGAAAGTGQQQDPARRQGGGAGAGTGTGPGSGAGAGGQRSGDLSQMLQRTPAVQLSDLHKGDAVMIVATQGTPEAATAVTLLAGVEPILTASPSASQSLFSASWNLGGGGGTDAAATP
jgi:hypothetical protein